MCCSLFSGDGNVLKPQLKGSIRNPGMNGSTLLLRSEEKKEERTPTVVPSGTITSIIGGNLPGSAKLSDQDDDEYRAKDVRKFASKTQI